MQTIKIDTHVGSDRLLKLELPLDISNTDLEVLVVVQPKAKAGWPPGYFERSGRKPRRRPDRTSVAGYTRGARYATMKYLLDTNTCIRYLNQRSERIIRKMRGN